MTASMVRQIVSALLAGESVARVARKVSQVLRRTEESRIYHWHTATGGFPPPRPKPPAPPHARDSLGNHHAQ
jgi:hypothetical protein